MATTGRGDFPFRSSWFGTGRNPSGNKFLLRTAVGYDAVVKTAFSDFLFDSVVPTNFPVVTSVTTSNNTSLVTSHTPTMPATVNAGELLIVLISSRSGAGTWTGPAGWTELADASGCCVYAKVADGTEGGASLTWTSSSSGRGQYSVWRITNWHGTTLPEVATTTSAGTSNPDAPSLAPSWGSADTLWMFAVLMTNSTRTMSSWPSSYTDNQTNVTHGSGSEGQHFAATRNATVSSEDPASATLSGASQDALIVTLAVRPEAANVTLTVDPGSITLTGTSVSLRRALRLSVSTAAIALTGSSVNLRQSRRLTVNTAAVAASGSSVSLRMARRLAVNTASVALTGTNVTLSRALRLSVNTAAVSLAGSSVNLRQSRRLSVNTAAVSLTGSSVDLTYTPAPAGLVLDVLPGAITLTGSTVNITASQQQQQPQVTGGWEWLNTLNPPSRKREREPEDERKQPKPQRRVIRDPGIALVPDPIIERGSIPTVPAWDAMAELQRIQEEAAIARQERLRAIALADDDWLMMA